MVILWPHIRSNIYCRFVINRNVYIFDMALRLSAYTGSWVKGYYCFHHIISFRYPWGNTPFNATSEYRPSSTMKLLAKWPINPGDSPIVCDASNLNVQERDIWSGDTVLIAIHGTPNSYRSLATLRWMAPI